MANVISSDSAADKHYLHNGFSSSITSSYASPSSEPRGISWDGTNALSTDGNTDKSYLHQGFSATITSSHATPSGAPRGISWDGTNELSSDYAAAKHYLHAGFSTTISASYSHNVGAMGLTWDGTDVVSTGYSAAKHYRHTGFSSTIAASYASPAAAPYGIEWDGTNVLSTDITATAKHFKHQGFSSTVTSSYNSPSTGPNGITWDARYVSGTTYNQAATGAWSGAGGLAALLTKVAALTGSLTFAGTLLRKALKAVAGALGSGGSAGKTYHVAKTGNNSNTGTEAHPWLTIQYAVDHVSAGDTILVHAGTYSESVLIGISGAAGAPLMLRGYENDAVTIAGGAAPAIYFTANRPYWTIGHFTITSTASINNPGMAAAIEQDSATGVDNLTVEYITANCSLILSGANNIIRHCTIDGSTNTDYAINGAIYFREARTTNLLIEYCTLSNFKHRGIWLYWGVANPTVRYNVIHDIAAVSNTQMGINADGYGHQSDAGHYYGNEIYNIIGTFGTGITFENGLNAPLVERNLIHNCTRGLGFINYPADGLDTTACNGIVRNNVIYGCLQMANIVTSPGWSFLHNTFADALTTDDQAVFYLEGTAAQLAGLIIKGNVYKHNGDALTNDAIISFQTDYTILTVANVAYNDWNHRSDNVVHRRSDWLGQTMAQWQAAGYDANSIENDPLFTDVTTHVLSLSPNSPAKNAGTNLVTSDYNGTTRPLGGGYDMGAYEGAVGWQAAAGAQTWARQTIRVLSMLFSGAWNAVGTVVRAMSHPLSGSWSGGGAPTKRTAKPPSGTWSGAGADVLRTGKPTAGAWLSGGAITRQAGKLTAGAWASGGTLAKLVATARTGAWSASGGLVIQTLKTLAGAWTAAGSVVRQTLKAIAGFMGNTGLVVGDFISGAVNYLQSVAGAWVAQGGLARGTSRSMTGAWDGGGGASKQLPRLLQGAWSGLGFVIRGVEKITAGGWTGQGEINRSARASRGGAWSGVGAETNLPLKLLAGLWNGAGNVARQGGRGIAGAWSGVGNMAKSSLRVLAGSWSGSGFPLRDIRKVVSGGQTLAGEIVRRIAIAKSGTTSLVGGINRASGLPISGVFLSEGNVTRVMSKILAGIWSAVGSLRNTTQIYLQDVWGTWAAEGTITKESRRILGSVLTFSGGVVRSTGKRVVGFWAAIGATVLLPVLETPPERTFVVTREERTFVVARENRTSVVAKENRTDET